MQRVTVPFEGSVWKAVPVAELRDHDWAVRMEDPAKLTDTIAANLSFPSKRSRSMLEIFDPANV